MFGDDSQSPDWLKRLGAAVGAAIQAGTADVPHPQQSTDKSGKGGAAAHGASSSSGLGSLTQYLPYVAIGGVGLLVLVKLTRGARHR
jgi:hypothetical protein